MSKADVAAAILDRVEALLHVPAAPPVRDERPAPDLADICSSSRNSACAACRATRAGATRRLRRTWSRCGRGARHRREATDAVDAPAPVPGAVDARRLDLAALRAHIGDCTRCKLHALGRTQIVFGVGNPQARLMFVGEAPGADEDMQGEPFVGRAGQLLTKIIEAIGLQRADVYIANVIKCRPPGNRNPEPDEVATCQPFLFRQIDLIQPRVIVALGTFAAHALLGTDAPISRLRGSVHDVPPRRQADPDVPSRVPAAQSRAQARRVGRHEESACPPRRAPTDRVVAWPCPCRGSAC